MSIESKHCDSGCQNGAWLHRRDWIKGSIGLGGIAMADIMASKPVTAASSFEDSNAKLPHFAPRAKRVIFLFMHGGPSHVDTFDYKPQLAKHDGKPLPFDKPRIQFAKTGNLLNSPWKFRQYGQSGAWVSDLFPHVAKHVDDLTFIKSMHGSNEAHGGAMLKVHTGSDTFVRPSMGSWISYGLGSENENLPSFITINPTLGHGGVRNFGSAFLPPIHQATRIGSTRAPMKNAKIENLASATATTPKLQQLQQRDPALILPRIIKTRDAALYAKMQNGDNPLRVLSYLPGLPLAAGAPPTTGLAANAGHFLGRVSAALKGFSDPAQEHYLAWDLGNGLLDDDAIWSSGAADIRALEAALRPLLKRRVLSRLPGQRRQVVHHDAHQDNLLRPHADSETVVGLIDFGDMIKSAIVCDLAILCLGFVERSISAQDCVAHAVAGYHAEFPLLTGEIDLLFDTMLARETLTVLLFDFKIAQNASASDYVREARPGLMKSLVKLRDIGASDFRDAIFDLCKL